MKVRMMRVVVVVVTGKGKDRKTNAKHTLLTRERRETRRKTNITNITNTIRNRSDQIKSNQIDSFLNLTF